MTLKLLIPIAILVVILICFAIGLYLTKSGKIVAAQSDVGEES